MSENWDDDVASGGSSLEEGLMSLCDDLDMLAVMGDRRLDLVNEGMDRIKRLIDLGTPEGAEMALAELQALEQRILEW